MSETILYKKRVLQLLKDLESEQIERTISTVDTNKFAQAVCAFSNDLHNTSLNGYLFIGAHDNGKLTGLKATDKQLQSLGGLRSDGNILPQPIMSVKSFSFDEGDVIVIEVQPSPFPPVRQILACSTSALVWRLRLKIWIWIYFGTSTLRMPLMLKY